MKISKLRQIVFLFIGLVVVGSAYPCPPPETNPVAHLQIDVFYTRTDKKVIFSAWGTDEDGGGIMDFKWDFPTGTSSVQEESTASCSSCGTGCLDGINCWKVSCKFDNTGKQLVKVKVKDDEGVWSAWAVATVYVAEVTNVEWERYDSSYLALDSHPDTPPNGGWRIFTGHKTPDDNYNEELARSMVKVKVTISDTFTDTPSPGMPVYLKSWDVDDPSADDESEPESGCTYPLDCDNIGHDNYSSDVDNETWFTFLNAPAGYSTLTAYVPANDDEVYVTVVTSLHPGDNGRVTAATDNFVSPDLTWQKVDSGTGLPSHVKRTDMLTVWRKLWIERDYMAPVPSTGSEKNRITGTAASYVYDSATNRTTVDLGIDMDGDFDDKDQFEGGRYVAGGSTYTVIYYTDEQFQWDTVVVEGDPSGDGAGMSYTLYDDDDQDLLDSAHYCSLGTYEPAFKEAYIEPEYLSSYHDEVPFNLNLTGTEASLGVDFDNGQVVWSDDCFWACLVVTCYQPETEHDKDPDGDGTGDPESDAAFTWGRTVLDSDNACVIFLETVEDDGSTWPGESKTVAHEVAHSGGADHADGGIMNFPSSSTTFTNTSKHKFRSNSKWLSTH